MSPAAASAKSAGPFSAPLIVRRAAAVPLRPRGFPSSPARKTEYPVTATTAPCASTPARASPAVHLFRPRAMIAAVKSAGSTPTAARKASSDAHDDGDRSSELERAAPPRVRDQAGRGLAERLGVATRAKMEEDAHGGDHEEQAAQRADGVPDPREAAARSQALDGAKEHEREETRRHDPESEPPAPPREDLRERARRPEGATSLEDRHARREAADHDVHGSAREETETRERVRDPLLRSSRLRGHARDSRRSPPRFRIRSPRLDPSNPPKESPKMPKSGPDR